MRDPLLPRHRCGDAPVGRFRPGPGFSDLRAERPSNVLMLEVSYWMSR